MIKILRAIYRGDLRFPQMSVFEYNQSNDRFEVIGDADFSYEREYMTQDSDFMIYELTYENNIDDADIYQIANSVLLNKLYMKTVN